MKTMRGVLTVLAVLVALPAAVFYGLRYYRAQTQAKAKATADIAAASAAANAQASRVSLPAQAVQGIPAAVAPVLATVNGAIDAGQNVLDFLDNNFGFSF